MKTVTPRIRTPFLVSVDQRLYVHFSSLSRESALKAYMGKIQVGITSQIGHEIGETDPNGEIVVHGTCAWGPKDVENLGTISLSEFGLTKNHVRI